MRCYRLLCTTLMFMLAVHSAGAQAKDTSTPPIIVELIKPDYPADARAAGVEGEVIVLVLVDKKGKVKVADAYGPMAPCSNLDDPLTASVRTAAVEAAKKAVFMPATFNGKPVDKGYTLKYIFDADNDDGKAAGRQNAFLTETGAPHVRRPVLLKVPKAKFPGGDAVGGIVDLRLLVYEDGRVHSVGPLSGHKAFRRAAMEAACKAVFQPAMVDGRPVKFQFLFRHNFYTVIERE